MRTWPPNDGWRNDGTVDEVLQDRAWTNLYIPYVMHCQSRGVYVVFCGNAPDGGQFMGAQHKTNMIRYWTRIFNRYPEIRDAENVMIEICNEPVVIETQLGNGVWQSDTEAADQAVQVYFQDIVNAIRATGFRNIIWVPGLIWQTRLQNFAKYPISGTNIGYAGHWYPVGENNVQNIINRFNNDWKKCADKYPIIVTEGSCDTMEVSGLGQGSTEVFGNTIRNLYDAAGNISWLRMFVEDAIGNMRLGTNYWTYPTIGCGKAAFHWWATYTAQAPSGSPLYGPGITFFQDVDYGGLAVTLPAGDYNMSDLKDAGVPNDWVSSVKIPSGYTVIAYEHDNFTGTSWTLTANTPNLNSLNANDKISSCKIIETGGLVSGNTYKIIARHSGKAMDAYGAQTANGTQIIQWTYHGGNNQRWILTDRGGGQWSIIGVQSGRCIDINAWGTANGTKVQLWDYYGNANQKYILTPTDNGFYRISPVHWQGSCLDVEGVSTVDGAKVHLWQWIGGANQQWRFESP